MTDTPNAALAYAVLDQIDAHPETWNQTVWDWYLCVLPRRADRRAES